MVEVWTEVPLAVVTVGRQSKSWSPSLSCCSGPWNVGQPSKLGCTAALARAAVAQSHNRQIASRNTASQSQSPGSRNGGVGDGGEGFQLAMLKWSMASLSLPRVWNIRGRSAGCLSARRDSRVGGVWFAVDTLKDRAGRRSCVFCWPAQGYRCQSSDLLLPTTLSRSGAG